jgi:hypothetical protein
MPTVYAGKVKGEPNELHNTLAALTASVAAIPQVHVDLGELAGQVVANAGFADAIATAVADKLAARLAQ